MDLPGEVAISRYLSHESSALIVKRWSNSTFISDLLTVAYRYHSHFSSQYAEGLWGPMVIHGPRSATYDIDLGPITLNDYFHRTYFDVLKDVVGATDAVRRRPASDNNLINGKMNFDCGSSTTPAKCTNDAGLSKFLFTSGKTHLLRLINTGSQGIQKFSIDNHMMTVIANDFVPVQPYTATVVTLAVCSTHA